MANLLAAHLWKDRWYANVVFAAQSTRSGTEFKHFMRMHIEMNGRLTIYPVGVRKPRAFTRGHDGQYRLSGEPTGSFIEEPFSVE